MKRAVIIDLEIPDEAPEGVADQVVQSFIDVAEQVAAEAREHFSDLIGISVRQGVFDTLYFDRETLQRIPGPPDKG